MRAEITHEQRERLYKLARDAWAQGNAALKSFCGADQADSEIYFCERRVYVAVAGGISLEAALVEEEKAWRAYAERQREKVDAAPKVKRGPMSGHSAISHRWVDPEKFTSKARHIAFMVRRALEAPSAEAVAS